MTKRESMTKPQNCSGRPPKDAYVYRQLREFSLRLAVLVTGAQTQNDDIRIDYRQTGIYRDLLLSLSIQLTEHDPNGAQRLRAAIPPDGHDKPAEWRDLQNVIADLMIPIQQSKN